VPDGPAASGQVGGADSDFVIVEWSDSGGAGDYAAIFRAHESELL
jgi:hypothetical protein